MGVAFACLLFFPAAISLGKTTFHVSVDGRDDHPGTEGQPFQSLSRAQQAVRSVLKKTSDTPVTVVIHPGTYWLDKPLTFTPADSGSAEAPVTYRAAESGAAILSGGMPIKGWQKGDVWYTQIDAVDQGKLYFHQLFVNGQRARVAATPNKFYLRTAGPIEPLGDRMAARRDPSKKAGFRFREGDFERWENLDDVFIELYHSWTTSLHWIKDLDLDNRIVRFTNQSHWPVSYWEKFERYRIHNHFDALDSPGEWYLDRKTGTLYYWPLPDEDMKTAEIIAPRLTDLLFFKGNPEEGQFVRHLRFIGLTFQHEDWNFDRLSKVDGQAHAAQQNAAITAFGLRDSSFERCEIAHVGSHAIRLDEGCQDNIQVTIDDTTVRNQK